MKSLTTISLIIVLSVLFCGCSQPASQDLKTKADVSLEQIHQAALRGIGLSEKVIEPPELGPEIRGEFEVILGETDNVAKVVQQQHERIVWLEEALEKLKKLGWFDYLIYGVITLAIIIVGWKIGLPARGYLIVAMIPTVVLLFGLLVSFIITNLVEILLILAVIIAAIVIAWLNREKIKEWDIIEDLVKHNEKAKKVLMPEQDTEIYGAHGEQGLMGTQKDITKEAVKKVKNR